MRKNRGSRWAVCACGSVIEHLEKRSLLSAVVGSDGTLTVTGTAQADTIIVDFDLQFYQGIANGSYTVNVNNTVTQIGAAAVKKVVINGQAGNDNISVSGDELFYDDPHMYAENAVDVAVNGGNGNDTINVSVDSGNTPLDFPSSGGPSATITAGDGNDVVVVSNVITGIVNVGNGNDSVSGSAGNDASAAQTLTVNAGNGNDTLTGSSLGGNSKLTLNGSVGTGHDFYTNGNDSDVSIYAQSTAGEISNAVYDSDIISGRAVVAGTGAPIANAIVFVDSNGNGILDAGEQMTSTDSNGDYALNISSANGESGPPFQIPLHITAGGYKPTATINQALDDLGEGVSGDDFVLTSTISTPVLFGTSGSYKNMGNTISKAVDGNLSTFFDAPTSSGAYVAMDYGLPQLFSRISYAPRPGWASRMVGGLFEASNSDNFSNAVTLYKVTAVPAVGKLTTVNVANAVGYRYVRYNGPSGSYCNIAEMKFSLATGKLAGTVIGTAGSYENQGNTIAKVFDGNLGNYFDGPDASGDWVGLDLGTAQVVDLVKFAPRVGFESRMVGGEIQASNSANFSSGVVTLATIMSKPTSGVLTTLSLNNTAAYRYYRYIGPANGNCNIAELEFDG